MPVGIHANPGATCVFGPCVGESVSLVVKRPMSAVCLFCLFARKEEYIFATHLLLRSCYHARDVRASAQSSASHPLKYRIAREDYEMIQV